jgi:hypothetical protein
MKKFLMVTRRACCELEELLRAETVDLPKRRRRLLTSRKRLAAGAIRFNDDGTRTIGEFAPPGTAPGAPIPVITPCPGNFFGDYDDIKFNPTQGHFVTTHTDSGCPLAHIGQRVAAF